MLIGHDLMSFGNRPETFDDILDMANKEACNKVWHYYSIRSQLSIAASFMLFCRPMLTAMGGEYEY